MRQRIARLDLCTNVFMGGECAISVHFFKRIYALLFTKLEDVEIYLISFETGHHPWVM